MTGALARALRAIRVGEPENMYVPEPSPMLPPVLSDQDFYRSMFQAAPGGAGPGGWQFPPSGAMQFGQVPGTLDRNVLPYDPSRWPEQQQGGNDTRWAPPFGRTL